MPPDLAEIATWLASATGAPWEPVGRLAGGETGASEIRRSDTGERAVVKWATDPREIDDRRLGAAVSERLRLEAGWPVPAVLLHELDDVLVVRQEMRPGTPSSSTPALDDQLLGLHAARLGLGAGLASDWPDRLLRTLVEGGDGYCLHEPLRAAGGRERRFVEAVEALGAALAPSDLGGASDLLHWDLHPGNVLVDPAGVVTAVIDTDFACVGDATFDLVTVAMAALEVGADPVVTELPEPYTGHLLLRYLDWALRKGRRHELERWWAVVDRTPALAAWR